MKAQKIMRLYNGQLKLNEAATKKIFLIHLGNVYAIKTYLVANLSTLAAYATYPEILHAIDESIAEMKLQLLRMDYIYKIMNEEASLSQAMGVRALAIETINTLKVLSMTELESDITILLHLNMMEGIEIASYTALYDLSLSMPQDDVTLLIKENLDMAKDSKTLYDLITKEYIN